MFRNIDNCQFIIVPGCELRLVDDGVLMTGEYTERLVPMNVVMSMRLPSGRVMCSFVGDEPRFYPNMGRA